MESISLAAYEQLAEVYFNEFDSKPYNSDYERPATTSLLPDVCGKQVLDAACAAGWYTKWLLDHGAKVTAVDFSANMVAMTRKRVGDRADIYQADLNKPLSFIKDASHDLIVSSLTLHYLKDWSIALSEFHRILKSNGKLVLSVHHPFMDFTLFNRDNYFLTELLDDEWNTSAGKITMQFYRRPLSAILSSLLEHHFSIEKLVEPVPTENFKLKLPEAYERLTKRPHFLVIRVSKV